MQYGEVNTADHVSGTELLSMYEDRQKEIADGSLPMIDEDEKEWSSASDASDDDSEMGDWVDVVHSDDDSAPADDAVKVYLVLLLFYFILYIRFMATTS